MKVSNTFGGMQRHSKAEWTMKKTLQCLQKRDLKIWLFEVISVRRRWRPNTELKRINDKSEREKLDPAFTHLKKSKSGVYWLVQNHLSPFNSHIVPHPYYKKVIFFYSSVFAVIVKGENVVINQAQGTLGNAVWDSRLTHWVLLDVAFGSCLTTSGLLYKYSASARLPGCSGFLLHSRSRRISLGLSMIYYPAPMETNK